MSNTCICTSKTVNIHIWHVYNKLKHITSWLWVASCIIIDALYIFCYANSIPPLIIYLFLVISAITGVWIISLVLHLCFHGQGIQWWHFAMCEIIMLVSFMLISSAINDLSISCSIAVITSSRNNQLVRCLHLSFHGQGICYCEKYLCWCVYAN